MPTDLTREEIERLRVDFDRGHDLGYGDQRALLAHALAEPARLAAARAEGVREGIETIITIAESDQRWRPGSLWDVLQREVAGRALSPAPAEPSAPVAPDWPTRCAALEADGIAARKRVAALEAENAKLRERNEALEDGLRPFAKLGELFPPAVYPGGYDEGIYCPAAGPEYAIGGNDLRRARAILQGGPDAG